MLRAGLPRPFVLDRAIDVTIPDFVGVVLRADTATRFSSGERAGF
jgi:hypothetical protein